MMYNERIKQYRTKNGITQSQIAKTLGITQKQYFKYEKGTNELPIRYLVEICKAYSIDANWLLGLTNNTK